MVHDWIAEQILAYAEQEAPRECCGLIAECFGRQTIWRLPNAAEDPETSFFIAPRDQFHALSAISDYGQELVAIFHSHPQGTPRLSEADRAFAAGWPGVAHVVAADGVIRAYSASGEPL